MDIAIITGSAGLIGAEATRLFHQNGFQIIGIDNDMRSYFFGADASTSWSRQKLVEDLKNYIHVNLDIRDQVGISALFEKYGKDIKLVIHSAAQPSHDWAAREPHTDFSVNATGTLNLLEATRIHCPNATFIFTSTNKVYGDTPNDLPLIEQELRWEIDKAHTYYSFGIDESMSIDQTKHSLFGASKAAADLMVQEYGRYFGLKTACFRGGCLTGPGHSGAELHGFLSYLVKCALLGKSYTIFGYLGKQVRDNIHSKDLVNAFYQFHLQPRMAEVYNMGGSRFSNCSILEAIQQIEKIIGKKVHFTVSNENRIGDHIWWISDVRRFQQHYPQWQYQYDLNRILHEIIQGFDGRL